MNETDLLLINRSGRDYALPATEIEALTDDADLLVVNRNGVDYKVSGKDFKDYLFPSLSGEGFDPDGNPLNDAMLFVFECLTDDVEFNQNVTDHSTRPLRTWINDVEIFGSYNQPLLPMHLNPSLGDVVKMKLEPSHFKDNSAWNLEDQISTPLSLVGGRIRILPETDISYITDDTVREFKHNSNPVALVGEGGIYSGMNVEGLENVRLGPDLSNTNNSFYIWAVRNGGRGPTIDLSKCRNPYAPTTKPKFRPGPGGSDVLTVPSYGLVYNSDYTDDATVLIPDWDTYVSG